MSKGNQEKISPTRELIHEIIFEADTPAGKAFDVALLFLILLSIVAVMLESVSEIDQQYHNWFFFIEWALTILFTIEYILRLYCVYKPIKYATSFFGIIDLLAILPTYISIFLAGSQYLLVIRGLRLLRVFRIFKLGHFIVEARIILQALQASRNKIFIFVSFVLVLTTILGSMMYLVEGGSNSGFTSIPRSIYWAIVTLTTVGYGDISPQTDLGQFLSAMVMILGYAVIAVPTGIVSAEFIQQNFEEKTNTIACNHCGLEGHDNDAKFCKYCGEQI